jgi:hypothetical protein
MKRIIFVILLAFAAVNAYAVIGTAGGPAPFLKMGAGARGIALSGAFSAYYDDASCPYWNPATAAYAKQMMMASMISWMTEDRKHNYINFTLPVDFGAFAVSLLNLSVDGLEGRPAYDTPEYYLFSNSDNALSIGYAKKLLEQVAAGAAFKLIFRNIDNVQAWGISFDAGVHIRINGTFSAAAVFMDFLNYQAWSTGRIEHILFAMKIAGLAEVLNRQLRLSVEAEQLESSEISARAGVEAVFLKILFFRAGCSYGFRSYYFDYTAGGGIKYDLGGVTIQADYAAVMEQFYLDSHLNHKFSLSAYF